MRLRTKIIFLMISVTLVMSVLLVRSQDVLLREKLEESQVEWVRTLVRAVAESIAQNIIDSDQLETRALLRRIVNNEEAISYIFITNFEGHLFTHTFDNGFPKVLIKHMQAEDHEASSGYLMDGEIIHDFIAPLIEGMDAHLHIGVNQRETNSILAFARYELMRIALLVTLLGIAASVFIGFHVSKPLKILTEQVAKYSRDSKFSYVGANTSDPDIKDLAATFQKMVEVRSHVEGQLRASKEELHEALILAENANRAKSSFLANMSHELRTPLNAIIGFSHMLSTKTYGPLGHPKNEEYVAIIHSAGEHLLGLIAEILDLSKIESGEFNLDEENVSLQDIVDECIHLALGKSSSKQVLLKNELPSDLPQIYADRMRIKQIIINLLENAIKFTLAGGAVTFTAAQTHENGISIQVIDTGIGIAPENIEKVLHPFEQLADATVHEKEGAGLGLFISEQLTKRHQGILSISSELGVGTIVTVAFPPERTVT